MVELLLNEKADINFVGESNSANLTCAVLSRLKIWAEFCDILCLQSLVFF